MVTRVLVTGSLYVTRAKKFAETMGGGPTVSRVCGGSGQRRYCFGKDTHADISIVTTASAHGLLGG